LIGEPQIHDALEQVAEDDLRIVVMHHPFDWLAEFDRNHVEETLGRSAHFILCGHQHVGGIKVLSGTSGECVIIPAGASYDRRYPDNSRYANGYNFVKIDVASGNGIIYFRTWGDRRNEWIEDVQIKQGGKRAFELPKAHSARAVSTASRRPRRESARLEAAARDYRDFLLKRCDIIDLTNLPVMDLEIAQRELALRRLYVPLRVQVELPRTASPEEPSIESSERRRKVSSMSKAYWEATEDARVSVGERLAQARRLVVLGDPGSGKTTLYPLDRHRLHFTLKIRSGMERSPGREDTSK
jgi:hypothetical protein